MFTGDFTAGTAGNPEEPLKMVLDSYSGLEYTVSYDGSGAVYSAGYMGSTRGSVYYNRDGTGRHVGTRCDLGGEGVSASQTLSYEYAYDAPGRLKRAGLNGKFTSVYNYDGLSRVSGKTLTRTGGGLTISESYTYENAKNSVGGKFGTTRYVSGVQRTVNGAWAGDETYTYDKNGNIAGSSYGMIYNYDSLNRITGEFDGDIERTYSYNTGGNLTNKTVFNLKTNTLVSNRSYTYGNPAWRDQLTAYDGQAITYDACGNPLSYRGKTLTWTRGRLLQSLTNDVSRCTNTYNHQGLRTKKSDYMFSLGLTVDTHYYLEGSRILRETVPLFGINKTYYYDADGICGFSYNGSDYYFRKNLQGDITHIYHMSGTLVGSYTYDAWGVCTIGKNAGGVAEENPFRYRGYYWDDRFKLYYLQSRYYDPEVGRFISPDSIEYLDPETINGLNLYAYCGNNPVMNVDPTGRFPILIALILAGFAIAGGVVGGKVAYDNAVSAGKTDSDLFWSTVGGVFVGASAGLAVGGLIVATGGAVVGAIGGISASAFGVTALQAFAIGAIAFNQFALLLHLY